MPGGEETFMSYDLPWSNVSNSPFRRHKSWVHEGGISTPLVVHWPRRITEPGIRTSPLHFTDVLPTLAELAGAPLPAERDGVAVQPVEGQSFVPSFTRPDWLRTEPIWFEHEGNRALRDGSWKLVSAHPGEWELYNIDEDRTETKDLIHAEPARRRMMVAAWGANASRIGVNPSYSSIWDGVARWHAERAEQRSATNSV
jgi:arylsulfatase A-like enzyme